LALSLEVDDDIAPFLFYKVEIIVFSSPLSEDEEPEWFYLTYLE